MTHKFFFKVNHFEVNHIGSPSFVKATYYLATNASEIAQIVMSKHEGPPVSHITTTDSGAVMTGPNVTYSVRKLEVNEL